jgi:hypothetical protein
MPIIARPVQPFHATILLRSIFFCRLESVA